MSNKQLKVGIIGAGTIGAALIRHIVDRDDVSLAFVLDPAAGHDAYGPLTPGVVTGDPEEAIAHDVDLVVKAAMPAVLAELAPKFLQRSAVCGFSCTALADPQVEKAIRETSREKGTRFYLPHGAVLGLDGIADGREAIYDIRVTTTKSGPSLGRDAATQGVLFDGSTREVCAAFPRNVNVHAAIALAGLGFDRTKSRIIAVPGQTEMRHRIEVTGAGLSWSIEISSHSLGGVTGAYTPLSAIGSLKRILGGSGLTVV